MERIAVVGASLHQAGVEELEELARTAESSPDAVLLELADALAASELVLLSTCNRIEVVYARETGHLPEAADRARVGRALGWPEGRQSLLRLYRGRRAVRHLLRVACSLDSLVVGEDQILAQVRRACEHSSGIGLVGELLTPLFEHASQVGKQVRTETELSRIPISVVGLGVAALLERLGERARAARIAVIGAGATGVQAALALRDNGIDVELVVNRSEGRAEALAQRVGARAVSLEDFRRIGVGSERLDAVVSATSAPAFALSASALGALVERSPAGRFVGVDLALPRDLEPVADPRVELIGLEALRARASRNKELRAAAAREAEELVERKLETFVERDARAAFAPAIGDVFAETSEIFERQLCELTRGRLAHLGEDERRAIERWARATFGRLAHVPLRASKRLARERPDLWSHTEGETTG